MKTSTKLILATTLVIGFGSAGVFAAATQDALGGPPAAVSLAQAIAAAEKHVSGRATRAEYEQGRARGAWNYDVEVVAGAKVYDIKVDPANGQVTASTEDAVDNDDARDQKD